MLLIYMHTSFTLIVSIECRMYYCSSAGFHILAASIRPFILPWDKKVSNANKEIRSRVAVKSTRKLTNTITANVIQWNSTSIQTIYYAFALHCGNRQIFNGQRTLLAKLCSLRYVEWQATPSSRSDNEKQSFIIYHSLPFRMVTHT